MNTKPSHKTRWRFWIVCILGCLWNAGGSVNYLMQTGAQYVSALPVSHQAIIIDRPGWATAGFAVGVFGGLLGCVLLMLKKTVCIPVLSLSLAGIVVTMVHTLDVVNTTGLFSFGEVFVMAIMPLVVALALVLYARLVFTGVRR